MGSARLESRAIDIAGGRTYVEGAYAYVLFKHVPSVRIVSTTGEGEKSLSRSLKDSAKLSAGNNIRRRSQRGTHDISRLSPARDLYGKCNYRARARVGVNILSDNISRADPRRPFAIAPLVVPWLVSAQRQVFARLEQRAFVCSRVISRRCLDRQGKETVENPVPSPPHRPPSDTSRARGKTCPALPGNAR